MKAVVQRVIDAEVTVNGKVTGCIGFGLLVYLGVAVDDKQADADWLAEKIANLRIFDDTEGKMNLSLLDILDQNVRRLRTFGTTQISTDVKKAGVLAISQFTLLGDARKGRRPSWAKAAPPETAKDLYVYFVNKIKETGLPCETGEFQARMQVTYTNEGPVTILLDSRGEG